MSQEKFRQDLAKFHALVAISDARIMSDPLPHLNRMSEHCCELWEVLNKLEYALSPDFIFDYCQGTPLEPSNIQGEALIRCNKALEILKEYKR